MGRLRRGHSLEVIFEDETTEFRPSIARLEEEELSDEWKTNYHRLSRRHILIEQQQRELQEFNCCCVQVTLCSQCCVASENMDDPTTSVPSDSNAPPANTSRRRNSTYLALACANAVSQGAMTRNLRQMFETQPVRETQPLLSRAEIKQQIQAARLRRNSIAVLYPSTADLVTAVPAVVTDAVAAFTGKQPPPTPAKPSIQAVEMAYPSAGPIDSQPATSQLCIRCDKCSSILTGSPVPLSLVIGSSSSRNVTATSAPVAEPLETDDRPHSSPAGKIVPTNREVVEEELPKPDTVKNARCLFESSFGADSNNRINNNFSTLQHVKSNPSSKILRSESSMTVDRAATGRPAFRWPSRQEHMGNRSPSPSPTPSPIPALFNHLAAAKSQPKMSSGLPSYYRSSPSLTQYRSSRHSTDVESYVSEGGSDGWSSDLESEASYSSSSLGGGGRDDFSDSLDGMRYISPDVMEKIRSYGMTLTFVNGKMVDEEDDDRLHEPEVIAKEAATRKVVQSIRSAGQSAPISAPKQKSHFTPVSDPITPGSDPIAPALSDPKKGEKPAERDPHLPASPPPRIVACLSKQEVENCKRNNHNNNFKSQLNGNKMRHSSGDSSASSGVSSATNAGSEGSSSSSSEHNSPFASLKRTKSANADHTVERSPSPGPRQSGTRKAVGSSPFGCYSVVYSFNASARSPMYV